MKHSPAFLALVDDAKSRIRQMSISEYVALRESGAPHVLIDTREESEWAAGHIAGAIYIGKGVIERDIESRVPDKDCMLVLYCGGGYRSALVAVNLQQMGYTSPVSLDGGWREWNERGLPAE
ncbi:MAG: sulfurtransferase [Candidatus Solibacter usitatus]|nr:sulfurtransferase [Candidatus Solibacter usitatus]